MPEKMKFINLTEDQFRAFIKSAFDEGWIRGKYEKDEDKDTLFNNSVVKEKCEIIIKMDNLE